MKKLISIYLAVLVLLFGCAPDSTVTAPEVTHSIGKRELIKLPVPKGLTTETIFTQQKSINGYNGGTFNAYFSYQSDQGYVSVQSDLVFPAGSFSGWWVTFSQEFNTETASLEFGPSMQFNASVKYTLTVTGVDLTGIDPNTLDFVYVDSNGNMHQVAYDSVTMNVSTGTLKVTNALLNHFSRYGFVN